MIPAVVADEVTGALRDFLATGFGPSNPALADVIDDFLAQADNLDKRPYLPSPCRSSRRRRAGSRSRRCR